MTAEIKDKDAGKRRRFNRKPPCFLFPAATLSRAPSAFAIRCHDTNKFKASPNLNPAGIFCSSDLLQEAKLNLQDLEATKDEISDVEFNKRYQELRQKLDELQHKKDIFEDAQRKLAVSTAKGEILMLRSDSVRRNRVLKLASFWQQMINYVFYVVFILNAFITGIGIASE